jgi:hypothetical protein
MERDSGCPRALDNGPRCRYFRGTDTWEAYAAGAAPQKAAAAVSNMQQRQSGRFCSIAERYSREGIGDGFKGVGAWALEDGMSGHLGSISEITPPACGVGYQQGTGQYKGRLVPATSTNSVGMLHGSGKVEPARSEGS